MRFDGDKVQQARERLGWTMEIVGQEADVSKNSILRAEHGGDIRPVTARRIAQALGVEVADLIENSAAPKAQTPLSLDDEQRRSVLSAVGWYWRRRAETHAQELDDANSPHFRDAKRATNWVEMVQIEARDYANWGIENAPALMPQGRLSDPGLWRDAFSLMGHLMTFHEIARRAERRIEAMSEQPDELERRRLEKARQEVEESESRLGELWAASG